MNSPSRLLCTIGLLALLSGILSGCGVFSSTDDSGSVVAMHMQAGLAYEQAGDLGNATRQYDAVIALFPNSPQYPQALWNAASLYLNEKNPSASDSTAASLLARYVALPGPEINRGEAALRLSLIERITTLRLSLTHSEHAVDSLALVVKKQSSTVGIQSQRLSELEAEVRQTKDELTRLKEVDVQLSRLHRRR